MRGESFRLGTKACGISFVLEEPFSMTPGSIAAETQLTPRKPGRLSSAMLGLNKLQKRSGKLDFHGFGTGELANSNRGAKLHLKRSVQCTKAKSSEFDGLH